MKINYANNKESFCKRKCLFLNDDIMTCDVYKHNNYVIIKIAEIALLIYRVVTYFWQKYSHACILPFLMT